MKKRKNICYGKEKDANFESICYWLENKLPKFFKNVAQENIYKADEPVRFGNKTKTRLHL